MRGNDLIWWALGMGVVYYFYSKGSLTLPVSAVVSGVSYVPVGNASGDQFQCPTGTKFSEIESMVNGSGYCS